MNDDALLTWADGHATGPNKFPATMKGWLESQIIHSQREICRLVCPDCHVRVGRIVESQPDARPVLYLLHAPPPRDRRGGVAERTLFGNLTLRQPFDTLAGPALLIHAEHQGDDPVFHGYLDSDGVIVVQNRTTATTWVDTGHRDGSWLRHVADQDAPTRVPKEQGPRRIALERGAGQPDNTTIAWRFIDPPETLLNMTAPTLMKPRGRLRDDEQCFGVCNAKSGRHTVAFSGAALHHGVDHYRRTGRSKSVVGALAPR